MVSDHDVCLKMTLSVLPFFNYDMHSHEGRDMKMKDSRES